MSPEDFGNASAVVIIVVTALLWWDARRDPRSRDRCRVCGRGNPRACWYVDCPR